MSEIEKIQGYISKHGAPSNPRYSIPVADVLAIVREMTAIEAVDLAFQYGQAKGYRMAKAEVRS